ncbi:MAG: hypothetical protein ACR2QC_04185 [Gammaproteobacteria bacterium]
MGPLERAIKAMKECASLDDGAHVAIHVAEHIHQAEQAAREQALEEAAQIAFDSDADGCSPRCYCNGGCWSGAAAARNEIENAIKALKTKEVPDKDMVSVDLFRSVPDAAKER